MNGDADPRPELLIVDDDPLITEAFSYVLANDFKISSTSTRAAAIRAVRAMPKPPELALVDLGLPPTPHRPDEGFALISELLAHAPTMRILVLSGQSEQAHARHARTLGALEYLAKPVDPEQLRDQLQAALKTGTTEAPNDPALQGDSPPIQALRAHIDQFADAPFPVLIEGESGTGKELVARELHARSARHDSPYLTLNCAAISPTLIESLLFGHARGSFTGATENRAGYFEEALGGTLFLDEIGDLPLELQPKLLRVLENGEFHRVGETQARFSRARVVTATNRDLRAQIATGAFREDLFHRLSVFSIAMPPLRELAEDRLRLLDHFRSRVSTQTASPPFSLDSAARKRWLEYDFPGNVRELRNITIRLQTKFGGRNVGLAELESELDLRPPGAAGTSATASAAAPVGPAEQAMRELQQSESFSLDDTLRGWEIRYIEAALRLSGGRMSRAARLLGVNRSTLYSRIDVLGLERPQPADDN